MAQYGSLPLTVGKSYASENDKYMKGMKGKKRKEFGHAGSVESLPIFTQDAMKVKNNKMGYSGYPAKAFDYQW